MPSRTQRTTLIAPSPYDEKGVLVLHIGIDQNGSLGSMPGVIEEYNLRHAEAATVAYEVFHEQVREAALRSGLTRGETKPRRRASASYSSWAGSRPRPIPAVATSR